MQLIRDEEIPQLKEIRVSLDRYIRAEESLVIITVNPHFGIPLLLQPAVALPAIV